MYFWGRITKKFDFFSNSLTQVSFLKNVLRWHNNHSVFLAFICLSETTCMYKLQHKGRFGQFSTNSMHSIQTDASRKSPWSSVARPVDDDLVKLRAPGNISVFWDTIYSGHPTVSSTSYSTFAFFSAALLTKIHFGRTPNCCDTIFLVCSRSSHGRLEHFCSSCDSHNIWPNQALMILLLLVVSIASWLMSLRGRHSQASIIWHSVSVWPKNVLVKTSNVRGPSTRSTTVSVLKLLSSVSQVSTIDGASVGVDFYMSQPSFTLTVQYQLFETLSEFNDSSNKIFPKNTVDYMPLD